MTLLEDLPAGPAVRPERARADTGVLGDLVRTEGGAPVGLLHHRRTAARHRPGAGRGRVAVTASVAAL
ncbi:MAG TPA: hypothetical protein VMB72_10430, partial [Acidimicrobiales bacterium]|nr:hypothetical protein [Acidimicrobiales bacterium]